MYRGITRIITRNVIPHATLASRASPRHLMKVCLISISFVWCRLRENTPSDAGVMAPVGGVPVPGEVREAEVRVPIAGSSPSRISIFVAPAMITQTGASLVKGGRRLSGRTCWNFTSRGVCAFGDACRFLHPALSVSSATQDAQAVSSALPADATPNTPHPVLSVSSATQDAPAVSSATQPADEHQHQPTKLLGYVTHKAQQQLGSDPGKSLLAEVLENSTRFVKVTDPTKCALLWAQSFTTGTLYDALPHGALVNHFPNTVAITHKHRLVLSLRELDNYARPFRDKKGNDVAPVGFLLPAESETFRAVDATEEDGDGDLGNSSENANGVIKRHASEDADEVVDDHNTDRTKSGISASKNSAIKWIVKRSVGGEGEGIAVCADADAVLRHVARDGNSKLAPCRLPLTGKEKKEKKRNSASLSGLEKHAGATHVVQRYIPRPILVLGRKVDLRVYVLVTSWGGVIETGKTSTRGDTSCELNTSTSGKRSPSTTQETAEKYSPPRAYVYAEGLVRFAADLYDPCDSSATRHLTNNALATGREHQDGDGNREPRDGDGDGKNKKSIAEGPDANAHFKRNWSFARFETWLDDAFGESSWAGVWEDVRETAIVAVEAAQPAVVAGLAAVREGRRRHARNTKSSPCDENESRADEDENKPKTKARRHFELLGLDVLIDKDLRVWLLEVNSAPSLMAGTKHRGRVSETHHKLKGGLIADAMNLLDAARGVCEDVFDAANNTQSKSDAEEASGERQRAEGGRFASLW